jgi:hypothetical protein
MSSYMNSMNWPYNVLLMRPSTVPASIVMATVRAAGCRAAVVAATRTARIGTHSIRARCAGMAT